MSMLSTYLVDGDEYEALEFELATIPPAAKVSVTAILAASPSNKPSDTLARTV